MRLSVSFQNQLLSQLVKALERGYLEIYAGPEPSFMDEVMADPPLVICSFLPKAFCPVVRGEVKAYPLSPGVVHHEGVASWFRACSFKEEVMLQGTVGKSLMSDLILSDTYLKVGDELKIEGFRISLRGL